jgi:hypothetical protein
VNLICPKCDFEQDSVAECERCGVIFDRYKSPAPEPFKPFLTHAQAVEVLPEPGFIRKSVRLLGLAALVGGGVAIALNLWQTPPLQVKTDPAAMGRVTSKLEQLQHASDLNRPLAVEFDEAEVNAWLQSLLLARSNDATEVSGQAAKPRLRRDLKIKLLDDHLRASVLVHILGTKIPLLFEGQMGVHENRIRFNPTAGKLGFLPLPQATLKDAVHRIFDAPEDWQKLVLPFDVTSIQIRRGELLVSSFSYR